MKKHLSSPFLRVLSLSYAREGVLLFKDLSFTLGSGEAIILVGPNGSGKTTLLRCLAGIPDTLPAITKGEGVTQAYVGHLNALKAKLTVWQNLEHQTQAADEDITKWLREMHLSFLADRLVYTLSAGQRRQIALAKLFLSPADLWLVDEPTSHLDQQAATRFWEGLARRLEKGGAAVVTSHAPVSFPQGRVFQIDMGNRVV